MPGQRVCLSFHGMHHLRFRPARETHVSDRRRGDFAVTGLVEPEPPESSWGG